MPKIVDPLTRRRAVADAVLRVVGREGVEGASLRNVAEEAGLAIGSVRHYFSDHDETIIFAMRELIGRLEGRLHGHIERLLSPAAGRQRRTQVEEFLAEFLPLDEPRREEAVLWQAFTTAARTRPELRPWALEWQAGTRALLARVLRGAQEEGGLPDSLDVESESLRLSVLLDGINLQAVLEPDLLTPDVQLELLRRHLQTLQDASWKRAVGPAE
ncbi:TetR/AcrR family transcriptional regulator [Streptomyces sp. MST-110588]|uniref:TetR/AcrR family transcriptional regulator n=1 Tax=Streptomyces sp. MST-110588 TaxID=2833628 RepID=UPI001F5D59DE|nr:TetR/AcrR family transcriptional regulator [Streptomyces sp. MST-110588]UNO40611.1 TetR/AcrR family transcriptional regulator [Streptomyces sp. MST-110588]